MVDQKTSILWNKVNSLPSTTHYKFPLRADYINSEMKLELHMAVWAK